MGDPQYLDGLWGKIPKRKRTGGIPMTKRKPPFGIDSVVGGWATPLKKNMSSSVGMIRRPMLMEKVKDVPNHQPVQWSSMEKYCKIL